MAIMRVTQRLMADRVLANLNSHTRKILELQERMASGQRVNSPSDDPIATRLGIDTRTALGKNEQYLANISAALPQLSETTTAIETALDYLHRVGELALQGANGTYSQTQLDNIATEVNQLLEGIVATANYQTDDRFIFSGSRTGTPAYGTTRNAAGEITAVTYQGNSDHYYVAVADNAQVVMNETGADVFQAGLDVFQTLINLRDDLRAGNQANIQNARIAEINDGKSQFLQSLARIGAVENRLNGVREDIETFNIAYETLLSDKIDADYAEVLIDLTSQSNAYQAALNAASRVLQPSLLDFIQ